ncbi:hypothetical protein PHMEG_0007576 [Phytophthora megakarya]|uniref:Uncharacterized protein n=1 Tax=Phytophthora megakarya TaxID=4795 RepID=A0A225WKW7_9STRA|nr:hypothetical protein PHMEG_0007576 [Phytophthora megakarya]
MTGRYKPELLKSMSYKYSVDYDQPERLVSLDEQTGVWRCRPQPRHEPIYHRSNIFEFSKKAILSFMSRINSTWDSILERGNPTRPDLVNKLIKRVKKFEVRHQGAESTVCRSVLFDEFINLLLLAQAE